MKRNSALIGLLTLGICVLGASALVPSLFPDTPEYPRLDTSTGTLGEIFQKLLGPGFAGNGTLPNTLKLGGTGATGYLKHLTCANATQVWTGVDLQGNPLCGNKVHILAQFGTLGDLSGSVSIYRDPNWISGTNNMPIYEGDILRTDTGAETAVYFTDSSILRLYMDTTVSLAQGSNNAGDPIAQVILQSGALWGRVLTSTGMNFGTNEYIAGVRGTSLALQKVPYGPMRLVIPHSTYVMMPAAMIYKTASLSVKSVPGITGKFSPFEIKDVTVDPIYINTSKEANIRDSLENISEFAPLTKTTPDYTVLYGDEWTRQNTLKDIRYFARKLKTLTPSEPLYARIQAESGATIPPILQTAFAEKLCNGIGGSGTPRTLWYSLLSYETEYCRESSLFAFLDYQNVGDTNGNLFTQNARILTDNSSSGFKPEADGFYIDDINPNGYTGVLVYSGVNLFSNVRQIEVKFLNDVKKTDIGLAYKSTCNVSYDGSKWDAYPIVPTILCKSNAQIISQSSKGFTLQFINPITLNTIAIGNKIPLTGPLGTVGIDNKLILLKILQ